MDTHQNFYELFHRYVNNQCTPDEVELVLRWLEADDLSAEQRAVITGILSSQPGKEEYEDPELQLILQRNEQRILQKINDDSIVTMESRKFRWWRLSAAAVIVIMAAAMGYVWFYGKENHQQVSVANKKTEASKDIIPGGNKAILTLANGKQLVLDEAQDGDLAQQGNTKIIKVDGRLAYHKENGPVEVVYNTISTPKGGQYRLVLSDGSEIWLNAASSLRFPTAFPGKERIVELTGEGYFEIAKNASQPFHVKVNNMDVEVLGTHFNIMAYSDESSVKTTLLEGSVKIKAGASNSLLKPGQQARLQNEAIKITGDVDVEEVVAWKNGYFQFDRNANLQQVMRQIARWYDVDISYEGTVPKRSFGGKISRDSNLSEALKVLELSKIHFNIDGRKLIVMP